MAGTWTNRAIGAEVDVSGAGATSITPTITSTTQGDTIIACLGTAATTGGGQTFWTPPAGGWQQAGWVWDGTTTQTDIWYLSNVPSGQTSYTFTITAGVAHTIRSTVASFTNSQGVGYRQTYQTDLGTNSSTATGTSLAVTTAGTAQTNNLFIAAYTFDLSGNSTAPTWTTPVGFSIITTGSASALMHGFFYGLSTVAGVNTITGSESGVSATARTGVCATFNANNPGPIAVPGQNLSGGYAGSNIGSVGQGIPTASIW